MDLRFTSILRTLTRPRPVRAFAALEARAKALFTPSDWLIVIVLSLTMAAGAFLSLASVSVALSVEVPMKGGEHVEAVVGTPRFVNPLLALSDTDHDLTSLVFSGLLRETAGGEYVPDLAEDYTISDDGTVYTFTLRDDIAFHDGRPVTADDVVFTVKLAQNSATKSPIRANWDGVEVAKTDEHTVTFTLQGPYAPFIENLTLGILPAHRWTGVRAEEFPFSDLNIHPVGTGPYRVVKVVRNQSGVPTEIRLAAFDRATTVPFVSRMTFRFYDDLDAVRAAVAGGAADAGYGVTVGDASQKTLIEAPYARIFAVFMNQNQNPLFADAVVRRALDRALDREDIVDSVLGGHGTPIGSPLPPKGSSVMGEEPTDPIADARQTLIDNGWTLPTLSASSTEAGETAVFTKKTDRLAFRLATANAPELKEAAEYVAGVWRAMGAEVTLEFFDEGDLLSEVIRPRRYDALLFGEVVGTSPDLYAFWHSSQRNDPGLNIALYTNSTVDDLLEEARAEVDPVKRAALTDDAASRIAFERGAIFLYSPHFIYTTEASLKGVELSQVAAPSDRFADVTNWYLKTEHVWPIFQ